MIGYIRSNPEGVSSQTLAELFLKFKNPDRNMAHITVTGTLLKDRRCVCTQDHVWKIKQRCASIENQPVENVPWAVVYLLCSGTREETILHISVFSPFESPGSLFSEWLLNPGTLSSDEQGMLISDHDAAFQSREETLAHLAEMLQNRTVLFFSHRQQQLIQYACLGAGETLPDDTMLLSQLFQIAGVSVPKPLSLITCYANLFNRDPVLTSAFHFGEALNECVSELFTRLSEMGITTRNTLEKSEQEKTLQTKWAQALFSLDDIAALPATPGIYGFKNRKGEYIYIGKARNLKRRVLSYFRNSEESPKKLLELRQQAHDLTIHRCGSELECLLLEYRLINKHRPILNTKISVNERRGTYTLLKDSVILLPHTDKDKGMSIWFRQNQKTCIKPFDTNFQETEAMVEQLDSFFFRKKLAIEGTDFPEHEIVFRWVKQHRDGLTIIPAYQMDSADQISRAIQSDWKHV